MTIAKCPYFGSCGGCSLQHLDYAVQLDNKRKLLANLIKMPAEAVKVFSGKEYGYRNRMDFIFTPTGLGFRKKGSWSTIINIENCPIADDRINIFLKELMQNFRNVDYFDVKKCAGTFFYAVIRAPKNDSSISFVLNQDSQKLGEAIEKIKDYAKKSSADNIIITQVPHNTNESISNEFFAVKGSDMLHESYFGKNFVYSVQGFFQNNSDMAEKMQEYVNGLLKSYGAENTKKATLLDLYAGVGTFGIVNSDLFKKVLIVENDKNCIDAAKKNIELNNVKNAEASLMDAKYLKRTALQGEIYVISDPPRSGMDEKTIIYLKEIKPKVIIYVSCNPQQLGKDIPKFKSYSIKSAALFDLFPQTNHSEAVVELALNQ